MPRPRGLSIATIIVLTAIGFGTLIPTASRKPFWHDEIYTVLLSRLPSAGATWRAELDGADLSPPLNLWLTRAVHQVAGDGPVLSRVPAMAGFLLMIVAVFALLQRRAGVVVATVGALLPFLTAGLRYGVEARAYGLMMGLAAAALYCWMEAADGRHRARYLTLLGVALSASLWNHYFGVLAFAPIGAGELVRLVRRRRLDIGVAVAIAAALLAAVPMYPLLRAGATQRTSFWAQGTQGHVVEVYAFLLNDLISPWFAIVALVALALIVGARFSRIGTMDEGRRVPFHEGVAIAVAAATPLLAVLLGRFVAGVFVPRYALGGVVGLSLAMPLALWRWNARRAPAELLVCAVLVYLVGANAITAVRMPATPANPVAGRTLLSSSLQSPGQTVVSSSLQFLQYWYYLPASLKSRVCYLTDPAQAMAETGSDTIDRGYEALGRWTALPVEPYGAFVAKHSTFRVYEAGSGWLLSGLRARHATIELIASEPGGRLYQVTMPVE